MNGGYGQFCPVAMAAEILCTRWTVLVLREMICGSTRFNELRKGVPLMSPALLSKRLKELEWAGVIERQPTADPNVREYHLTEAGRDLKPIIIGIGTWGQRYVESQVSLRNLDPSLLMWDMRRHIDFAPIPRGRSVVQFLYPEVSAAKKRWWLVLEGDEADLCGIDPGFPVDLYVEIDLRTMTSIWMGLTTVREALDSGKMMLDGRSDLKRSMQRWLGLSPFAKETRRGGLLALAAAE